MVSQKQTVSKVKSKIQSTRLKEDYEFLKKLEQSLETIDENPLKTDDTENESDQGELVLNLVKGSINYLDHRAEFWTNMK